MITNIRIPTKHKAPKMSKATMGNLETDENNGHTQKKKNHIKLHIKREIVLKY